MHVKWDELPDEKVRPGVSRRAVGTPEVMLVLNECQPGMEVRPHSHDFTQLALILSGTGRYHVAGVANEVGPGSILVIPPGAEHFIEPEGDEPVMNLDVFAPARADYAHLLEWMAARENAG